MWQTSKDGRIDRLIVFRATGNDHIPIGELRFEGGGLKRLGRFAYAASFLKNADRRPIDPISLPLTARSKPAAPDEVQSAFHDAGPDGWGKSILTQAFPGRVLSMPEFLALGGVNRTGDLAFGALPDEPPFTWVPTEVPLMRLPSSDDDVEALLVAAAAIDRGEASQDHLQCLLRQSADIGGARPKARLRHDGKDRIAKFPAWGDTFDDPRVEAACLDVAEAAGLRVPRRDILDIAHRTVLLLDRFDRSETGDPYAYLSAGTLLSEPPSAYADTQKTYVDIADIVRRIGGVAPNEEMFRRWLVNAHLHNTDDHLRNHAVLYEGGNWSLSPVFDIVPHPGRRRHVCAPAPKVSPEWAPTEAADAYLYFGLSRATGERISDDVITAVRRLPDFMDARRVTRRDRSLLAPALSPVIDNW